MSKEPDYVGQTLDGCTVEAMMTFLKLTTSGPREAAALLVTAYIELMKTREDNPSQEMIAQELMTSVLSYKSYPHIRGSEAVN